MKTDLKKLDYETRGYTNKLLELLEEGFYSYETILKEMLSFFSEEQIKDFCLNSFGNVGIFEEEEEENEVYK
jgi:hypothetical protein